MTARMVMATLGQFADMRRKVNPKLSARPQNQPVNLTLGGRKKCTQCGEEKDAYRGFSWRTRKGGRQSPRSKCKDCEYLNLKDYRRRKCTN